MKSSLPSTLAKILIPLALIAIAGVQVAVNKGHVDNNIVGALVFIGVGGTAGYAIDRLIQNLYWARSTGGVERHRDDEEGDDPRPHPRRRRRNVPPRREREEPALERDEPVHEELGWSDDPPLD